MSSNRVKGRRGADLEQQAPGEEDESARARRMRITLATEPASIELARRAVERLLEGKRADELDGRLKVVVSELVTNAVLHGYTAGNIGVHNSGDAMKMAALRSRQQDSG